MDKTEAEDAVEYWLYPTNRNTDGNAEDTLCQCYNVVSRFTEDFIWHRQPFSLGVKQSNGEFCLKGRTKTMTITKPSGLEI